jgi:hypothetical protein
MKTTTNGTRPCRPAFLTRQHRGLEPRPVPTSRATWHQGPSAKRILSAVEAMPRLAASLGLRVTFTAGDSRGAGYPEAGVVTTYGPPPESFNLNEPGMVSSLIARALETGWDPAEERRPREIVDGFELLLSMLVRRRG